MNSHESHFTSRKIYTFLLSIIAWYGVIAQYIIRTGSAANFISYFTIECNILIAVSLTVVLLFPSSKPGLFFSKLSVQTAIALYIFIVGLIYNLVLRSTWSPQGIQLIVDNIVHVAVPGLYVLYWVLFRTKEILEWKQGLYWTIFPLSYLVYSLVRGVITHWYPYPFLNVDQLGYSNVFVNALVVVGAFFLVGMILIAVTRSLNKQKIHKG